MSGPTPPSIRALFQSGNDEGQERNGVTRGAVELPQGQGAGMVTRRQFGLAKTGEVDVCKAVASSKKPVKVMMSGRGKRQRARAVLVLGL